MPPVGNRFRAKPDVWAGFSSLIQGSGRNLDKTDIMSGVGVVEPQEDENDLFKQTIRQSSSYARHDWMPVLLLNRLTLWSEDRGYCLNCSSNIACSWAMSSSEIEGKGRLFAGKLSLKWELLREHKR